VIECNGLKVQIIFIINKAGSSQIELALFFLSISKNAYFINLKSSAHLMYENNAYD